MKKIVDLNVSPYYDSSQKELDKGYVKYLATEGQVLQNRELNVAQGLIYGNLRKVTDLIIDDGAIISGCNFINNEVTKICTLYSGEIYVNGIIVKVPEKSWPYKTEDDDEEDTISTENTIIYVEIAAVVYNENDDKALYDPAENMENYGNAGGHRLKYEATVGAVKEKLYNEKALASDFIRIKLYRLSNRHFAVSSSGSNESINGNIDSTTVQPISLPIFGKVYKQLAQNTYDASGDFIAEGMQVNVETNKDNPLYMYNIVVAKGRAYVRGYSYSYNTTTLVNNAATDLDSNGTVGENKTYHSSVSKYYLNHTSVASVSSVSGTLQQNNLNLIYTNGTNVIPSTYIVNEILTIRDASKIYPTTYYTLHGNTITWLYPGDSSKHPTGTFFVTFLYTGSLSYGVDFTVNNDANGYYISFSDNSTKVPADSQTFNIKYSWYLSRIDLVYVREDGILSIKNGIPGLSDEIKKPTIPAGALPLAVINVDPAITPSNYSLTSYNIYRVPTAQLQNMKTRLSNLEYDVAMTKLENDAQNKYVENDSIINLKNIFVDGVVDFSKADTSNAAYDATLDFIESEISLPLNINTLYLDDVTFIKYNTSGKFSNDFGNGILTLDIDNKPVILMQYLATSSMDLTPYYFKGLQPTLSLYPKHIMTIDDQAQTTVIWLPTKTIYKSETVEKWLATENIYKTFGTHNYMALMSSETSTNTGETTSSTLSYTEIVDKTNTIDLLPQPYIKEGELLTITGNDWPANSEIRIYLDNSILSPSFTDVKYTTSSPFVMPASTDLGFESNTTTAKRSNVWKWQGIELSDVSNVWKISHPLYQKSTGETDGIAYYFDYSNNQWYYHRENGSSVLSTANLTKLTDGPSWAKFLTRSPWINHYLVTDISSKTTRDLIENINNIEPLTDVQYTNAYASTKLTIITDSDGSFTAQIAIPANTAIGTHTITAETILPKDYNPDYYFTAKSEFSGDSYIRKTASYIYKQKTDIITDTTYIYKQNKNTYENDPLAQSFTLDEEQYLSGIDIYFYNLPFLTSADNTVKKNYWFFIRILEMSNGYPTNKVLYSKIVTGADTDSNGNNVIKLATDLDSSGNLLATHIDFEYPIYVEGNKQYAFSIGSNRNGFRLLYAKMGSKNLLDNTPVTLQPISNGVMFTSSDSNTWTALQDSDITYKLYGVTFSSINKSYYLTDIQYSGSGSISNYFSTMNVSLDTAIFENTEIDMSYGINVNSLTSYTSWLPLTLEERYSFLPETDYKQNGMKLSLKFVLSTTNTKLTPMINLNSLAIYLSKYKSTGSYLMNSITISN
jgi:hypothetical protein